MTSEKENPWSEDETDTCTTIEVNEPIEVDDDISHKASENKEQGKFQSRWAFFAWLRSRDETKIKNQSKQNKYADPGYRRMMYNCMGHTWR
jgi:hypothetical protein